MTVTVTCETELKEIRQLSEFKCPACGNEYEIDPPAVIDEQTPLNVDCSCGELTNLKVDDLNPMISVVIRITD